MKAFFLTRQLREKALLLVLILGALAFWLPRLIADYKSLNDERGKANEALAKQQEDLVQETAVMAKQKEVTSKLDPEKSFDKTRLQAEIVKVAGNSGIATASINFATSRAANSRQMSIITQRITLSNVDMGGLVSFYRELAKKTPYITIVQCAINSTRGGGGARVNQTTATPDPTAGGRGGRGGAAGGGATRGTTVGPLDIQLGSAATTRGTATTVARAPSGPPGSMLNVTLDLTAISLKGTASTPAPAAPARATAAPAAPKPAPAA